MAAVNELIVLARLRIQPFWIEKVAQLDHWSKATMRVSSVRNEEALAVTRQRLGRAGLRDQPSGYIGEQ